MGKLITVMELLADVGLGRFVEQARLGWPIWSIRSTLVLSVFFFLSLTENSTSAAVGVSLLPSERTPDSVYLTH